MWILSSSAHFLIAVVSGVSLGRMFPATCDSFSSTSLVRAILTVLYWLTWRTITAMLVGSAVNNMLMLLPTSSCSLVEVGWLSTWRSVVGVLVCCSAGVSGVGIAPMFSAPIGMSMMCIVLGSVSLFILFACTVLIVPLTSALYVTGLICCKMMCGLVYLYWSFALMSDFPPRLRCKIVLVWILGRIFRWFSMGCTAWRWLGALVCLGDRIFSW